LTAVWEAENLVVVAETGTGTAGALQKRDGEPAAPAISVESYAKSLDSVAATMDKHGTSAWVSGAGLLAVGFALATTIGDWAHISSAEFIAVMVVGMIFVIAGVAARMYARVMADRALLGLTERLLTKADTSEDRAVALVERFFDSAPKRADSPPRQEATTSPSTASN
jgi:hypothetical protein